MKKGKSPPNRASSSGFKLKEGRVRLDKRNYIFMRVVKH